MADYTNINAPNAAPGAAPTTNTATAGPDTFTAQPFGKYLVRINNTGGAPVTATFDDPVTQNPGNAVAFNPDIAVAVTNAQARAITVDANRHRDPTTGKITIAWSATPTATVEIHGPF